MCKLGGMVATIPPARTLIYGSVKDNVQALRVCRRRPGSWLSAAPMGLDDPASRIC